MHDAPKWLLGFENVPYSALPEEVLRAFEAPYINALGHGPIEYALPVIYSLMGFPEKKYSMMNWIWPTSVLNLAVHYDNFCMRRTLAFNHSLMQPEKLHDDYVQELDRWFRSEDVMNFLYQSHSPLYIPFGERKRIEPDFKELTGSRPICDDDDDVNIDFLLKPVRDDANYLSLVCTEWFPSCTADLFRWRRRMEVIGFEAASKRFQMWLKIRLRYECFSSMRVGHTTRIRGSRCIPHR